jgi:hypothetical protein
VQAAKDLGMDPNMPGSAAFAGLKYPATAQLSDFFDLDACRQLLGTQRSAIARSLEPKRQNLPIPNSGLLSPDPKMPIPRAARKTRRSQRAAFRAPRKDRGDR